MSNIPNKGGGIRERMDWIENRLDSSPPQINGEEVQDSILFVLLQIYKRLDGIEQSIDLANKIERY